MSERSVVARAIRDPGLGLSVGEGGGDEGRTQVVVADPKAVGATCVEQLTVNSGELEVRAEQAGSLARRGALGEHVLVRARLRWQEPPVGQERLRHAW